VLLAALFAAAAATLAEAASPRGTDNLSVPLVAAGIVLLIV
jgi:phytol kinase